MKINPCLLALFAALSVSAPRLTAADASAQEVEINASDNMKFDVTTFTVAPGASVHVTLNNKGTLAKDVMGHNWILLRAGVAAMKYANASIGAKAQNYQPATLAGEVIASIGLLGARQSGEVTFVAPMQPGRYAYLCSFPAHCQAGMSGFMVVQ